VVSGSNADSRDSLSRSLATRIKAHQQVCRWNLAMTCKSYAKSLPIPSQRRTFSLSNPGTPMVSEASIMTKPLPKNLAVS